MSSGRSVQAPSPIAAGQSATPRSTFARPPLEPLGSIFAVCLDEGISDGMDGVGVRSHVVLPCRKAAPCRLNGPPPKRPPLARSDSGRLHVGRMPHIVIRGTLRYREWQSESCSNRANAAATPTRAGRRGAVVRSAAGERRSSRKRTGRLRYDPQCGGPSGVIREPAVPFAWSGTEARIGAAEHALALKADWCRNAYGARQSVDIHDVTRGPESPMQTITSMFYTGMARGSCYIHRNEILCLIIQSIGFWQRQRLVLIPEGSLMRDENVHGE